MTRADSLLPAVKRALTHLSQYDWPQSGRLLYDTDRNPYAILTTNYQGERRVFCAKHELHNSEYASFMPRLVDQALHYDAVLVLFVGEKPSLSTGYVFDPEYVMREGVERVVTSKQAADVTVLDISVSHGALLGDFIAGVSEPTGVDRVVNEQLDWFGVQG